MAIIKCKMCGGDIRLSEDKTFGTCEYCGSTMTLPRVPDEQRAAQFNRGNHFRRQGEFDKALAVYERIVAEDDTDAEAHWCCALCRFGIEYVEDPGTYEYIPTCHRASFDSFLEDVDYLAALEHSDGITKRQYQKDAAKIAEVQRGILATSQKEEPFDVFICYKETDDETKERTRDSLDAQEIYYNLTQEGYRVFFARITLEDKAGTEYEPYIFAALNSAKVMVVIGEKAEYFNAVWVKNEWSRFLSLMRKDRSKLLLPCYKNVDPYDLPEQLGVLQSYDMAKIGFMQDLTRGIRKVLAKDEPKEPVKETVVVQQSSGGANLTAQLKRGMQALEDRDWSAADGFFDKALDMDAECAEAFFGKALAAARCSDGEALVRRRLDMEADTELRERRFACSSDDKRIAAAVEQNVLPGFLEAEELRKLFNSGIRDYSSMTKAWQARLAGEKPWWEGDRNVSRALRYAKGGFADKLRGYMARIEAGLQEKLAESEAADEKAAAETVKKYAEYLTRGEESAAEKRRAADREKEKEYQRLCQQQKQAERPSQLSWLATCFADPKWKDYEDCAERVKQCREAVDRLKAEAEAAAKRKKKKTRNTTITVFAVLAVIIAAALVVTQVVIPKQKLDKANSLRSAGEYEAAIALYQELGKADLVLESKGEWAEALIEAEDYEAAYALLNEIGNTDRIDANKHDRALILLEEQDYEAAYKLLRESKDIETINSSKYERGVALLEVGDYDAAYALLRESGNDETINASKYERGVALLEVGDYDTAYALLHESGNDETINKNKYERALALLEIEDYEIAYKLLQESGNDEIINANKYERALILIEKSEYVVAYELLKGLEYKDSEVKLESIRHSYEKPLLTNAEVGSTIVFGSYEQDNDTSNGKEDVEWYVMDREGNKLLVISRYALGCQPYNTARIEMTWEKCTLRNWLNGVFFNTAFSAGEQDMIPIVTVSADNNPEYDTSPGNSTQDRVFLLSIPEVNRYFASNAARECRATAFAEAHGVRLDEDEFCGWWLRSPGANSNYAAFVNTFGPVITVGNFVDFTIYAVRPVMWIDFGS